jgi:hypothetical protein
MSAILAQIREGGLRKGRIESWDYVTESGFRLLTSKVSVSASPPIGGGFFFAGLRLEFTVVSRTRPNGSQN